MMVLSAPPNDGRNCILIYLILDFYLDFYLNLAWLMLLIFWSIARSLLQTCCREREVLSLCVDSTVQILQCRARVQSLAILICCIRIWAAGWWTVLAISGYHVGACLAGSLGQATNGKTRSGTSLNDQADYLWRFSSQFNVFIRTHSNVISLSLFQIEHFNILSLFSTFLNIRRLIPTSPTRRKEHTTKRESTLGSTVEFKLLKIFKIENQENYLFLLFNTLSLWMT